MAGIGNMSINSTPSLNIRGLEGKWRTGISAVGCGIIQGASSATNVRNIEHV